MTTLSAGMGSIPNLFSFAGAGLVRVESGVVELASLGYRTDLAVLRFGGTHVEDRGDYLVIRSPHNPTHWWGNFLLLPVVPADDACASWLDRFAAEFPHAGHAALGFDRTEGTVAELGWFAERGFTAVADVVMTASAVHEPARPNTDAVYRRLDSEEDWAQSIGLQLRCRDPLLEAAAYRRYVTAKAQTTRALVHGDHGGWFGAFLDGRLVSQMGLINTQPGVARFQSVETDPSQRRRGLAGSLVHHVSQYGLGALGVHTLVMVADPNDVAIGLYRSVGFIPTETQLQVERRPV